MPDSQEPGTKNGPEGAQARPDAPNPAAVSPGGGSGHTDSASRPEGGLEHWRHVVDERIRMILPSLGGYRDLQQKVEQLGRKVAELEAELARRKP